MALLVLIPLLGYILFWRRVTDSRSSSAALHSASAILLVLYFGSLAGLLQPTTLVLIICGSFLAISETARLIIQKTPLPLPLGILLFLCSLFALLHHDATFYLYDEFSHWGVFLKELLAKDILWSADSNAMVLRYPPGAPLWQYFFLRFSFSSEANAYLAQFCLLMIPLLVLWQNVKLRQLYWLLAVFALVALGLSNFGHGFASLYVDHLLGAWFAGTLFNFMLDLEDQSATRLLSYFLPITTLVLIKDAGLYFAVAASGIFALLIFWRAAFKADNKEPLRGVIKAGTLAIVCIASSGLIATTWNANRNSAGIPQSTYSTGGILSGIVNGKSELSDDEHAELTRRFWQVIFKQQISKDELFTEFAEFNYELMPAFTSSFRMTTSSLILLFVFWQIIVLYRLVSPQDRWRWAIGGTGLVLTTIVYIAILFLSYHFAFGERRMILPSYLRYVHTALLPILLFAFLPLLPSFSTRDEEAIRLPFGRKGSRSATIFAALLATLFVVETPHLEPLYKPHVSPEIRQQMKPYIDNIRNLAGNHNRVWIYLPVFDYNGIRRRIFLFDMSPVHTEVVTDPEYLTRDPAKIQDVIANWDYLWFPIENAQTDMILKSLAGEDLKEFVFRVDRSDGGTSVVALDGVFD